VWLAAASVAVARLCAGSTDAAALPESARYYASGLGEAYSDASAFVQLSALCRTRFPQECGRDMAAVPNLDNAVKLSNLITLFERSPAATVLGHPYAKVTEVQTALLQLRAGFMTKLREYDEDLFAKYGAVSKVCPAPNSERVAGAMTVASGLEFMRYWGLSLHDYTSLVESINARGDRYVREIRASWTIERCVSAREFGHGLFAMLITKDRPYTQAGWQNYTNNNKFGQGAGYIWNVAVSFEAQVHPEVLAKAKELVSQ
jgi:hypothetical protein